ncbi:MAG: molybdenum ABC transporter ATP-binding protein [Planctomycetota bacterium]
MNSIKFSCQHEFGSGFSLTLDFETDHQIVALFGPSGSGKTSLLSMLAGFLTPDHGRIQIGDKLLFDSRQRINLRCEKRHIGLVSQDHLVFPHMNVESNLNFGRHRNRHLTRVESDQLFKRICAVLNLQPLLKRSPKNLSGGESQRVAIGRALMSSPKLLLLDEPLSSLDAGLKLQVMAYLEEIISDLKIPVVFVSHRQGHVRRLADWVVVIEEGRKVAEGTPDEALTHSKPMAWKNTLGPVNLLGIENVHFDGKHWKGLVGDQELHIPAIEKSKDKLFLQFTPRDVTLSHGDVSGLSSRNQLRGMIRQIVSMPHREFIAVDIGQIIWAEITSQSVEDLNLKVGQSIYCLVKSQCIEVIN